MSTNDEEKAIWIVWEEEEQVFIGREFGLYGTGELIPIFETRTTTRRARYSNEVTDHMLERAHEFIKTDRPDGRVEIM